MNTRRIAAAAAIVLVVGVVVVTITAIAGELGRALGQLALFVVVLAAGWMAVTRWIGINPHHRGRRGGRGRGRHRVAPDRRS